MSNKRHLLRTSRRWVIKIGSALLTDNGKGLDRTAIKGWVGQIADLVKQGHEVVLVSSGAVAAGMTRLGWKERPQAIHELQAAAAVGQMGLIQTYEDAFQSHNLCTAQILLDHDDLYHRQRYLNARSTLRTLTKLHVIPVVNENDTVVTDEIRFGDNDTLGALVANLIQADVLMILTDQLGMYDSDPRQNALAKIIDESPATNDALFAMAGGGGSLGRGGMTTKVRAARLAERSGTSTVIVGGRIDRVITRVAAGESVGTLLYAEHEPLAARKRWLAGQMQSKGVLVLDDGAVGVLRDKGKSLLPVGVKEVHGEFLRGDLVICRDLQGREIARGLVNYSSDEARKIAGQSSTHILQLLGYKDDDELIHRDNLVLV
ncbi:glutamate 5-kinase [Saccharophagus sp. K07]|uniref:glutamate 5-kinase n=1 Tax=Saccharophagus sp. K07 TaxID=2283636 RepID=UPI001651E17F|nr:glutamate 5-kinase [Saccharophagus sp. K07]MBC6904458.1 glutamate 5-kinase [Saccharophagus sp. K07]